MAQAPNPAPFDWQALEGAARAWVRESPAGRQVLQLLLECFQRALAEPLAPSREARGALDELAPLGEPPVEAPVAPAEPPALEVRLAAELLREGLRPRPPAEAAQLPAWLATEIDVGLVARRARLKAEAIRWATERRRRAQDGTWTREDVDAGYRSLIERAKQLPNCYLWMLAPDRWLPEDAHLEQLAAAFENLAVAVEIELAVPDGARDDDLDVDLLTLIAECQSALRVTLKDLADPVEDNDQAAAYFWLKAETRRRQVYVARHMRLDDPAPPGDWYERGRRLAAKQEGFSEAERRARERTQAFSKLRYHARRIQDAAPDSDLREDWRRVLDTADKLLALGVNASSKELRDLVITIEDRLPESLAVSDGWRRIDRHIDEYLALLETEQTEPRPARQRSPEVERAAQALRGRRLVLIGGHVRPRSREALMRELELGELDWISTKDHESLDVFEPAIAHPDTAVVVLMIRWSNHSYGGVKAICDAHDKLLVRLPGGYGPNQLAAQVMEQVGERLVRRGSVRG